MTTAGSSSDDLHPRSGARFVFARSADEPEPMYRVAIYLADGRTIGARLAWPDGRATLTDEQVSDPAKPGMQDGADLPADGADLPAAVRWARDEALKLARVLRASGQTRLTRWRG